MDKPIHITLPALLVFSCFSSLDAEEILQANIENGRHAFHNCSICHKPEGWGSKDGVFPQIAGQHLTVIIKQLEDIRSHKRENKLMDRFAAEEELEGAQEILDVATYISRLPMTRNNGKGPGKQLKRGDEVYRLRCLACHGIRAEGSAEKRVPMLAGQHFRYLELQFEAIRNGTRGNSDPEMVERIKGISPDDAEAVLDYISRISPSKEKLAPRGWKSHDQSDYSQDLSPGLKF